MKIKLPKQLFSIVDQDGNTVTPDKGDTLDITAGAVVEETEEGSLVLRVVKLNGKDVVQEQKPEKKQDKELTRDQIMRDLEQIDGQTQFGG